MRVCCVINTPTLRPTFDGWMTNFSSVGEDMSCIKSDQERFSLALRRTQPGSHSLFVQRWKQILKRAQGNMFLISVVAYQHAAQADLKNYFMKILPNRQMYSIFLGLKTGFYKCRQCILRGITWTLVTYNLLSSLNIYAWENIQENIWQMEWKQTKAKSALKNLPLRSV